MERLIIACIEFLNIKAPVSIRFQTEIMNKKWRAYHISWAIDKKITRHVIRIRVMPDDGRNCETIIAHEFIHAWQSEYAKRSKVHGIQFQRKAKELREYLVSEGYDIAKDIYDSKYDI